MGLMQEFDALLDRLAPDIARAFREAIRDITDNVILRQVIEAIERNDFEGAFRALGVAPASFNGLFTSLQAAFEAGGMAMAATFPKYIPDASGLKARVRFNVRDPRAEKWLQERSSGLVVEIEDDIRRAVRNTLTQGLADGRNPRNVALDIVGRVNPATGQREGGVVGLGSREEKWSRSARTYLTTLNAQYFELELRDKRFDATVEAAMKSGTPLPQEAIDKLVDRYRSNALQFRGEAIGRTEALAALNRSEWEATKQAVEQGNLTEDQIVKIWDAVGDQRTRHSHKEMDGQRRKLDEPFVSPDTNARLMFPGDTTLGAPGREVIACRCRVRYEVDWFAGVK
jgi:hypothetical protein